MVKVISKNTFISFDMTSQQEEFPDSSLYHHASARSRSAECVRDIASTQARENLTNDYLQRLNAVFGMSPPRQHQSEEHASSSPFGGIAASSEAHELQEKAGVASATRSPGLETPLQRKGCKFTHIRNASNSSLSTTAPDDVWESQIRHVGSSGSVNTMVDGMSESDENIKFQINMEELATPQESCVWPDTDSEDETQPYNLTPQHANAFAGRSYKSPLFSHCFVPRCRNWESLQTGAEKTKPPTTLMIRNIPGRLSQKDLVMELQDLGFAGTFDFLYIPMDKNTCANVGYAFVNFVDPSFAEQCMEKIQGHVFTRCRRGAAKVARVSVAHLQGLKKNLQHYENSAVNSSKQTQRRPLVLTSIGKCCA